jgi:Txe/YoeB family toxin of toxin-antitoxin system
LAGHPGDSVSSLDSRDAGIHSQGAQDFGRQVQRETGMVKWKIVFTRQAQKDARKIAASGLREKAEKLLSLLSEDPFKSPPSYEKLVGDLSGAYSRRINIQHRLVYQVLEDLITVKIIRMWTHYE